MKTSQGESFSASMRLDDADGVDGPTLQRRMATYSIEAIRVGSEIDKIHVMSPDFGAGLRVMERLFQIGTEFNMPQGARIEGPPGVGKTSLFRFFVKTAPRSTLFSPGMGVIGLRVPLRPKTGHFVSGLLASINYPFSTASTPLLYQRRHMVIEGLRSVGTRLIFLDEAQNLTQQPRRSSLKEWECESTEFLRQVMDEAHVSIVLAGTHGLSQIEQVSEALASRVAVFERMKNFERDLNWAGFVRAFTQQSSSFDLAYLCEPGVTTRLHYASGGNPCAFKRLVTEVVLLAVDAGVLSLNAELLAKAFYTAFGHATAMSNPFL